MSSASSSRRSNAQRRTPAPLPPCGYLVTATKKGALPVSVEKRPKGKKVTIISNVHGSANALLSALGALLGTGGTTRQEKLGGHWLIEVQGNHVERVGPILSDLGCVRGLKLDPSSASSNQKEVQVVSRICGYDKFLRRGPKPKRADIDRDPMPGAECRKWHGPWVYCRGTCFRADCEDVFEEGIDGPRDSNLDGEDAGATVETVSELSLVLRDMGMFAEPGAAVRRPALNPNSHGKTLADYGQAATASGVKAPGEQETRKEPRFRTISRRVTGCPQGSDHGAVSSPASTLPRQADKPVSKQAVHKTAQPPPKVGRFTCSICEAEFSLAQTLRMHVKRVHPEQNMPTLYQSTSALNQSSSSSGNAQACAVTSIHGSHTVTPVQIKSAAPQHQNPDLQNKLVLAPTITAKQGTSQAGNTNKGARSRWQAPKKECPVCFRQMTLKALENHVPFCEDLRDICPICGETIAADEFQCHVARCSEAAETSRNTDKNLSHAKQCDMGCTSDAGVNIEIIAMDFEPLDGGCGAQIRLSAGDPVQVHWKQPTVEGGFWAYGAAMDGSGRVGYFPIAAVSTSASSQNRQTAGNAQLSSPDDKGAKGGPCAKGKGSGCSAGHSMSPVGGYGLLPQSGGGVLGIGINHGTPLNGGVPGSVYGRLPA